jgi:DNA invertase Pin-like site-specific DNA recombinase
MSGSSGKAMRNLMAVFAEYQSDVTGEYTRSVKANLKKHKKVYSAYPPLGFQHLDGTLVGDPNQMKIVEDVYQMKAKGHTLRQIAEHFNSQGIKGSKNGKFHASTIAKILTNSIYETKN